ncbi:hypothetical protein [Streptomyces hokutonensis]|uniref:hypothetical protein n=1 Tax=Streptomyces hokutonensis TaxID=1306990 RepID=UPI00369775FB
MPSLHPAERAAQPDAGPTSPADLAGPGDERRIRRLPGLDFGLVFGSLSAALSALPIR